MVLRDGADIRLARTLGRTVRGGTEDLSGVDEEPMYPIRAGEPTYSQRHHRSLFSVHQGWKLILLILYPYPEGFILDVLPSGVRSHHGHRTMPSCPSEY